MSKKQLTFTAPMGTLQFSACLFVDLDEPFGWQLYTNFREIIQSLIWRLDEQLRLPIDIQLEEELEV